MKTIRVVLVTIPKEEAEGMAKLLVEKRLAACVNVIPRITSFYRWEGKVQVDEESLLVIKTTQLRFDELMGFVKEEHPYELPEILALPIEGGLPEYAEWILASTNPDAFEDEED